MGNGTVVTLRTNSKIHFLGAIAQNAIAYEDIVPPAALTGRSRLRSISMVSLQNLDWEIFLWSSINHQMVGDLDSDKFVGKWLFQAGDASQIAAGNQYYYYIDGLDEPYNDEVSGLIHIGLIPRSAAKVAGPGQLVLSLTFEPTI